MREWSIYTRSDAGGTGQTTAASREPDDSVFEMELLDAETVEAGEWPSEPSHEGPRPWQRSDPRLLEELTRRLLEQPELDLSHLRIHVREGVVRIDGEVSHDWERQLIHGLVLEVPGVRRVQSRVVSRAAEP